MGGLCQTYVEVDHNHNMVWSEEQFQL